MTDATLIDSDLQLRQNIAKQAADEAQVAIEEEIEKKKKDVREGKSGFWARIGLAIAEFLDKILHALGFDSNITGFAARLTGNPIPDADEIKKTSEITGRVVSETLTDKNFTYSTRDEFEAGIKARVVEALATNSKDLPSLDDAKITEIGTRTATAVGEKAANTFDDKGNVKVNPFNLSTVDAIAAQKFADSTQAAMESDPKLHEKISALLGKDDVSTADLKVIGAVIAPKLAQFSTEEGKAALMAQGEGAYASTAAALGDMLQANKGLINGVGGIHIGPARLQILADSIANSLVNDTIHIDPPKEFVVAMEGRKQAAINETIYDKVSTKVFDQLKEHSVAGILKEYDGHGLVWLAVTGKTARIAQEFYDKDDKGDYTRSAKPNDGRLKKAEQELYQFAIDHNLTLNDEQRRAVGDVVAMATVKTLDSADLPKNPTQVAAILERNIRDELIANEAKINDLNPKTSVAQINVAIKGDLFASISREFADQVRNDAEGSYQELSRARDMLVESKLVMTGSKNKLPGGSAHGISGASQVDHIAASHARNAQDAPLVRR